jgi:hypothetical protein
MSLLEFEAFLETVPRHGELSEDLYAQLSAQMERDDQAQLAMRAALVLARVETRASATRLLAQLEARHEHPERPADAVDVVAAASLASSPYATDLSIATRLELLADGSEPHPDLEVRTECARTALLLGNRAVAPFLLRLTRLDTPLGLARDGAWHATEFSTWSRNRAAETLAEVLGIACPYRADNHLPGREAAAKALEDAWLAAESSNRRADL